MNAAPLPDLPRPRAPQVFVPEAHFVEREIVDQYYAAQFERLQAGLEDNNTIDDLGDYNYATDDAEDEGEDDDDAILGELAAQLRTS